MIAVLLSLVAPVRVNAENDLATWAKLESSRWENLSILYPPSIFDVVRPPEDHPTTIISDVDRLVSKSGDFEVVIGADDVAVGSASEYIRIELASDLDMYPLMKVTYRARGKSWEVASGFIKEQVFYYKSIEYCTHTGCDIPTVSIVKFMYATSKKGEYDKLLEGMVRTLTPATGRI